MSWPWIRLEFTWWQFCRKYSSYQSLKHIQILHFLKVCLDLPIQANQQDYLIFTILDFTIQNLNLFCSSYLWSTLAVASSMTRILLRLRIALARHNNCRCPTLKLRPPSETSASNWPCNASMTLFSWTYGAKSKCKYFKCSQYLS